MNEITQKWILKTNMSEDHIGLMTGHFQFEKRKWGDPFSYGHNAILKVNCHISKCNNFKVKQTECAQKAFIYLVIVDSKNVHECIVHIDEHKIL